MGRSPGLGEARAPIVRWMLPGCPPELADPCVGQRQPGNRLFWGTVAPSGLLVIGVVSHELRRRVCLHWRLSPNWREPWIGSAPVPGAVASRRWCWWRPTPGWASTISSCSGAC